LGLGRFGREPERRLRLRLRLRLRIWRGFSNQGGERRDAPPRFVSREQFIHRSSEIPCIPSIPWFSTSSPNSTKITFPSVLTANRVELARTARSAGSSGAKKDRRSPRVRRTASCGPKRVAEMATFVRISWAVVPPLPLRPVLLRSHQH
jgi:hypothetical protein